MSQLHPDIEKRLRDIAALTAERDKLSEKSRELSRQIHHKCQYKNAFAGFEAEEVAQTFSDKEIGIGNYVITLDVDDGNLEINPATPRIILEPEADHGSH